MQIHLTVAFIVIIMGFVLKLNQLEWALILLVIGLVLVAEMFNTCVELIMDHISPQYHVVTKHIKDISAGAVLVSAITAMFIGLIIFLPKISAIIFCCNVS